MRLIDIHLKACTEIFFLGEMAPREGGTKLLLVSTEELDEEAEGGLCI